MAVDMRKWSFFLFYVIVVAVVVDAVVFYYLSASIVEFVVVYVFSVGVGHVVGVGGVVNGC